MFLFLVDTLRINPFGLCIRYAFYKVTSRDPTEIAPGRLIDGNEKFLAKLHKVVVNTKYFTHQVTSCWHLLAPVSPAITC